LDSGFLSRRMNRKDSNIIKSNLFYIFNNITNCEQKVNFRFNLFPRKPDPFHQVLQGAGHRPGCRVR
jgi:hypothetical protein